MTVKDFFKKLLCHACCYFSVCMLVYIAIAAIINVNDDALLLEATRTVLFFVFSLLLALANTVLSIGALSGKLKVIIHYLVTTFAFYACFMLPLSMRASSVLVGLVIFTFVYFIILGIIVAFKSRYRRNAEKAEKYEKHFSKR